MTSTAEKKKISMIPAKPQYDRSVKFAEKRLKVAAYCRVSTELEQQESSYEAQVEYYTNKIEENQNWKNAGIWKRRSWKKCRSWKPCGSFCQTWIKNWK